MYDAQAASTLEAEHPEEHHGDGARGVVSFTGFASSVGDDGLNIGGFPIEKTASTGNEMTAGGGGGFNKGKATFPILKETVQRFLRRMKIGMSL
ncbi:uncharacterized protein Dvir_GJ26380 [Drosophila virilis]|uniref:Uncharacterized protein n=1 Tax=Drosophila virilis TaxID=7244 RepID=A0A0Q9WED2_DROVI|nr:uncharacterized protein Dvir_GJ26380 [Drosophila virilis]